MRLLITGGCGFIGSAVIRHIIRQTDHAVINVDAMTYAASEDALEEALTSNRHTLVRADIADAAAMREIFDTHKPDAVMHLAAESHVDRSIDGPADFMRTNIMGTFTLLEAARAYYAGLTGETRDRFRFHHVSTDEVFGALEENDPPFKETTAYDPRSPYSSSKAAINGLTVALALELAPDRIRVNAICPGLFMTEPNKEWARKNPQVIETFVRAVPMGRAGEPEEIGPLAVYLASPASSYVTGAAFVIDGGYTLW